MDKFNKQDVKNAFDDLVERMVRRFPERFDRALRSGALEISEYDCPIVPASIILGAILEEEVDKRKTVRKEINNLYKCM